MRIVALRGLDLARTPTIEGGGTHGGDRPQAFRRHVVQGPSRNFERTVGLVERPVPGQVEVQKHRVAVGRQQDVRWLHIAMDDVAALRMVKGVGQPGRDPGHGLAVGQTVQDLARRTRRIDAGVLGGGDGVEVLEQIATRATRPAEPAAMIEDGREGRASQERHADELECSIIDHGMRQDLDDVGMPCPGQQPWLARWPR